MPVLYRTIMADPPWPYRQPLGRGRRAGELARGGLPYSALSVEEIAAFPIGDLSAPDCMCWLWSTNSHLHEAFHVLEEWGFTYKTMVTWDKGRIGLGYWLRGATEHLLLGIKGNPRSRMKGPHGATGMAWSTIIREPPQAHSVKPQAAYDMAEALGEPPRLELFARRRRLGWDAWGNQV